MRTIQQLIRDMVLSRRLGSKVEAIHIKVPKEEPIQGEPLKAMLNEILSPKLAEFGLSWNSEYFWYNDKVDSSRKVFHYRLCKGCQGTIIWGVSLDFIPRYQGMG